MSISPPRKRDWTPGKHQVGVFVRFPDGAVIEITLKHVDQTELEAALALVRACTRPSADRGDPT